MPPGRAVACVALVALAVFTAGCAPVAQRVAADAPGASSVGASGGAAALGSGRARDAGGGNGGGEDAGAPAGTVPTPEPAMAATFEPAPGSADVRPDTPVRVLLSNGRLTAMTVTSSTGPVAGTFDGGSFTPAAAFPFGQTFDVTATAESPGGSRATFRSTFTTLVPAGEITADIYPLEGDVVGVGMPVIVAFSSAVPLEARAALTARFAVTSLPAVEGGWRWIDESTMHWRPRAYWPAGTRVTVTGNVAGRSVGHEWFTASTTRSFSIGPAHRLTVDARTYQMVAYENGQPIRIMPISAGKEAYPTASGIDLIMEKYSIFEMDSSSVGIFGSEAYLVTVADAQRLTNSGTFIHAAPWNGRLGEANLSHGCINASSEDAAWMMEFTLIGDPVEISGTPEQVSWDNGWGAWNLPFEQWVSLGPA